MKGGWLSPMALWSSHGGDVSRATDVRRAPGCQCGLEEERLRDLRLHRCRRGEVCGRVDHRQEWSGWKDWRRWRRWKHKDIVTLAQKSGWSWHTPDGLQSTPSWLFLRVFLFCAFSCFPRLRRSPNFSSFFHLINRCGISIKVQCQDQVRWTQQIWSRGWWVPLLQLQGLDVCEAADHLRAAGLADGHRQADRGNGLRHRCAAGFWSGHVEHWGGTQAQHVGDASGQITNVSLIRSLIR